MPTESDKSRTAPKNTVVSKRIVVPKNYLPSASAVTNLASKVTRHNISELSIMRTLGIMLVLGYHLFPEVVPGGFIGVDIFFVLSGYLISSIFMVETESGPIKLLNFYTKRIRRLLPTLLFTIVIVTPAFLLVNSDYRTDIIEKISAALSWSTNWYQIFIGGSYTEQLIQNPFVHTWTLGVEVQYYIIWSVIVYLISHLTLKHQMKRTLTAVAALSIGAISAFAMVFSGMSYMMDYSPIYFSTFTHLFPLMIGSAFGAIVGFRMSAIRLRIVALRLIIMTSLVVLTGGIILLAFTTHFNDPNYFISTQMLVSVLVVMTILLIIISCYPKQTEKVMKRTLTSTLQQVFDFISDYSYAIYLIHFPLLIVVRHLFPDNFWALLSVIPITFGLAYISPCNKTNYFSLKVKLPVMKVAEQVKQCFLQRLVVLFRITLIIMLSILTIFTVWSAPMISSVTALLSTNDRSYTLTSLNNFDQSLQAIHNSSPITAHGSGNALLPLKPSAKVCIIADSVVVASMGEIDRNFPGTYVDAKLARTMWDGIDIVEQLSIAGTLAETVVINLATMIDYTMRDAIDPLIQAIGSGHHIVFVTGYKQGEQADFANILRILPDFYPFIEIADYAAQITPIAQEPDVLTVDNYHPGPRGAKILAQTIIEAVNDVQNKPLS